MTSTQTVEFDSKKKPRAAGFGKGGLWGPGKKAQTRNPKPGAFLAMSRASSSLLAGKGCWELLKAVLGSR